MPDVTYEIVQHDGGWAYKVDGVFSEPFPTHAEALRQSILAMIDAAKSDREADPLLWAPFVVVGEPAKPQ